VPSQAYLRSPITTWWRPCAVPCGRIATEQQHWRGESTPATTSSTSTSASSVTSSIHLREWSTPLRRAALTFCAIDGSCSDAPRGLRSATPRSPSVRPGGHLLLPEVHAVGGAVDLRRGVARIDTLHMHNPTMHYGCDARAARQIRAPDLGCVGGVTCHRRRFVAMLACSARAA